MNRNSIYIILLLLIAIYFSCQNSDSPVAANDNEPSIVNQTYKNPNIGIAAAFPDDWSMQMNIPVNGYDALLLAEKNVQVSVPPSVTIIFEELNSKLTMDVLLSGVVDLLPGMLENVEIIDTNITELDGCECGEIIYTFTEADNHFKQQQFYILNKIFVIIISFNADKERYDSYKFDFATIQDSMELI